MRKEIAAITASLLTGALVVGCSTDEAGTPTTSRSQSTSQAQSTDDLPHSGAPAVTSPIATERWEAKPCDVLTASQLSSIGLRDVETEPDTEAMNGSQCNWYTGDLGSLGATFLTNPFAGSTPQGLSTGYANSKREDWELFREVTVEGQPAIIGGKKDGRNEGECGIAVGLRDDLAYSIRVNDPEAEFTNDPCGFVKKIATLAVETMKGGA